MSEGPIAVTLVGPWPPPAGGIASHLTDLREFLEDSGYRTRVLAESAHASEPGVVRFDPRRRAIVSLGLAFATVPERGGILHSHGSLTAFPARSTLTVFQAVVRARALRWVETLHDQTLIRRFEGWPVSRRRLFEDFLHRPRHIIAIGPELAAFARNVGADPRRLTTSTPLVSANLQLESLPDHVDAFVQSHKPMVVGIGALTPSYDFASMLRAFARYRYQHAGAGLVLAATDFAREDAYSAEIGELAGMVGASLLRVTDLPRPQLLGLISRSDVVLRGPDVESFGLIRAEAALLRKPVVGTRTGSDQFSVAYEHGDAVSLYDAMTDVLDRGCFHEYERAYNHYREIAMATQQDILHAYHNASIQ